MSKRTQLRGRTEPCGISFPHVFRVGTGWDGDTELSRKSSEPAGATMCYLF